MTDFSKGTLGRSPPMIKLITISFFSFFFSLSTSPNIGQEGSSPSQQTQRQGNQVYIQVQLSWGLKSVAPSPPSPADRLLSPEIPPPQVSSHHHLQNFPFALMKNENQTCQSSLFHEEIFHHHDLQIPIVALLIFQGYSLSHQYWKFR